MLSDWLIRDWIYKSNGIQKKIIVTGASKGLGRAICDRLISKGMPVIGIARNVEDVPFPLMSCEL